MQQSIAEANAGNTHAEFAAGAQNGTIGFKCIVGEPQQFIRGARKAIFNLFVLLYMIGPLILVPLWAYHQSIARQVLGGTVEQQGWLHQVPDVLANCSLLTKPIDCL